MRLARNTVPGAAALHGQRMAVEHALDLGLADDAALVFFLLAKRSRSAVQSSQLSPRLRLFIAPFASMQSHRDRPANSDRHRAA